MQKKSLETVLYSSAGIVLMLAILVAFNFITGAIPQRLDLTHEKAYTLSAGTRAILKKLDTPVTIRFYCSQSEAVTPDTVALKSYARKVEDLLAEYRQIAGKNLKIEKYDPQPDSDAEDSARLDGIEPQVLAGVDRFYLGMAMHLADQTEAIPVLSPTRERLLEYDITRAIARVMTPEKPTLGIMSALPVFGTPANPMMMQMGQQGSEPWALVNELQGDFNVRRVAMDAVKIDDDIRVLLVIHPKDISDPAQYAIDQFIMRGGKLIAFLDPQCITDRGDQNPMLGNMGGSASSLDKLLQAWGLQFDTGKVVADLDYQMQLRGRSGQPEDAPGWLGLTPEALNQDDIVTSQIDSLWLPLCGAFTGTPVAGLRETVLAHSSKDSQLVDGTLASLGGEGVLKDFKASGVEYKLAVRLDGRFKTAFPEGKPAEKKDEKTEGAADAEQKPQVARPDDSLKETRADNTVVLVGDADFIYDQFTLRRLGPFLEAMNGNLAFVQNAIEQLSGDASLIGIRSRATSSRPFTVIKQIEAEAQLKGQSKVKELQDSLDETERKLNELQQQRKDATDQRFILSPEQHAEIENFRKKQVEASRELKQVQKDLRKEVVSLEMKIKWINVLAMPLAVTVTGILIAMVKRKKTSAK